MTIAQCCPNNPGKDKKQRNQPGVYLEVLQNENNTKTFSRRVGESKFEGAFYAQITQPRTFHLVNNQTEKITKRE